MAPCCRGGVGKCGNGIVENLLWLFGDMKKLEEKQGIPMQCMYTALLLDPITQGRVTQDSPASQRRNLDRFTFSCKLIVVL